jgi:hypothetical protein
VKKLILPSIIAAVALAVASAASAATSASVTATGTVTGASALSLATAASQTFSDTLDGTDQTASYTIPLTVIDATGTGAGWNTTITSTLFTTSGSKTLASSASSITGVTSACVAGGTCTNPTNSLAYAIGVPAAATAPAAVKFFNAAATTGMGRFTITPTIQVAIPGNSFAGSYTSTVTVAVVSGP